jgi:hypothetical protein
VIKPVEIFSQDPGRIMDFSGVPVAEIFNGSVLARSQAMEREAPVEEPEPLASFTPQTLFNPDRGAELFQMPRESTTPAPSAGRSTSPGSYPSLENYDAPLSSPPGSPEDFIFNAEARRDARGQLQVYTPPAGDGGGSFEVAGITARYQPKEAARLKALIESGQVQQAEAEAKDFYRRRAAPFTSLTDNPGLQLQLADTVHHRGEGGLRRVLQRATGSDSKDYRDLIGMLASDPTALDKFNQARQSYEWEEVDRGRSSRKKFRKGLQNRFNRADAAARSLITGE